MSSRELADTAKRLARKVGTSIRELRTSQGLTQAQLALSLFSLSYISAVELGKIRPSLQALVLLAKRLGVSPGALLGEAVPAGERMSAINQALADEERQLRIDVTLQQAEVLFLQRAEQQAGTQLASLLTERLTGRQSYTLLLLDGQLALERNAYRAAEERFQDALAQAEVLGEETYQEAARNLLGLTCFLLGDYKRALELHRLCLVALERDHFPDPFLCMEVLGNLASDYCGLRKESQAVPLYQRAVELYDGVAPDSPCQIHAMIPFARQYLQTSLAYRQAGRWTQAWDFATRSLSLYKLCAGHKCIGLTHQCLGKALERLGDPEGAEQAYQRALARVQEIMDDSASALCHISLAELALSRGQSEVARQHGETACILARSADDPQTLAEALLTSGAVCQAAGLYADADALVEQALQLLEGACAFELAARGYARYAGLLEQRAEYTRSLAAWKQAYQLRRASRGG